MDSSERFREAARHGNEIQRHYNTWVATGAASSLVDFKAEAEQFRASVGHIGASANTEDQRFARWAARYFGELSTIVGQMIVDPSAPGAAVTDDYLRIYVDIYQSLQAGDLGDPGLANRLTPPADLDDGAYAARENPAFVITSAIAEQRAEAAQGLLVSLTARERVEAIAFPVLYGVGIVLVILLTVLMFVADRRASRTEAETQLLRRIATTDPLTALGNRRGFEEAVKHMLQTNGGQVASLVLMDLDEFKEVNDTFGHERGDSVLKAFAGLLSAVAPPGAGRFRIGGDEFALILHGYDGEAALALAERTRLRATETLMNGVTVSAGVAALGQDVTDDALLRQQADAALYEAKLKGRNLVVLYREDDNATPLFPAAKLQAVRELLVEGRIEPVFQPVWDIHSKKLLAYEGLSRPHPSYGLDGPQQAFDIAERFGRAADLDHLCRTHVLAAVGSLPTGAQVFINLSPYSLTHHSFSAQTLIDELEAAAVSPARVVFEITERSQVPTDAIVEALRELRRAGIRIALDDVGSGNNGLELLGKVPFEYLKVDRSIMVSAASGGSGRAALMAILAFAAESGVQVIAEGVENIEMFRLVREVAISRVKGNPGLIHGVQGFLFGCPVPVGLVRQDVPGDLAA